MNANQTPWKRLVEYYDANAADRTRIVYTFLSNRMKIQILVHRRVPVHQFKILLRDFYRIKAREDVVSTDDLEICVVERPAPAAAAPGQYDDQVEDGEDAIAEEAGPGETA